MAVPVILFCRRFPGLALPAHRAQQHIFVTRSAFPPIRCQGEPPGIRATDRAFTVAIGAQKIKHRLSEGPNINLNWNSPGLPQGARPEWPTAPP